MARTKNSTAVKPEENDTIQEVVTEVKENIVKEETIPKKVVAEIKKKPSMHNIPLYTTVWVKSNCYGGLIYVSKKSGFKTTWENFGSRQPLSLEELLTMRNADIKFYTKNLIVIEGFQDPEYSETYSVEEILTFLQVTQYYTSLLCPDNLDEVFKMTPAKVEECVPNMSAGVRNTILIRANELIEKGEIDSIKMVRSLEKALGCELSEVK